MHTDLIHQAADLLKSGDQVSARLLLEEALRLNPADEQAWLWLSGAVETDQDRLACLQEVLAIDPDNPAARAGVQALSMPSSRITSNPEDTSLETFLKEQEARAFISPPPVLKKDEKKAGSVAVEIQRPFAERITVGPVLSPAAPLANQRAVVMAGLLKEGPTGKSPRVKKSNPPLIPWNQLTFTNDQIMYFILGLIITFLILLIGFSGLKTLLHGPRYRAAPPAAPTPVLAPTSTPEPAPLIFNPTKVTSDCRFTVPQDAHVECLTMILPETRDGSSARSVRLPLVIYRSLNPFPPPDPIFYLHGSDSGSAIEWAANNYEHFILPLLYQRDVIVMEPRGIGQATPNLDCPEMENQYLIDLRSDPDDPGRAGAFASALHSCRDRLTSQGIRFSSFNTASFAADIADTASVLGYDQINLYGLSFGGSVAQVVLRNFPELVRSAVLDSAYPLEGRAYNTMAAGAESALKVLFETCVANSSCRSTYPNLEAVFNEVTKKLAEAPLTVPSTSTGSSTAIKMTINGTRFQQAVLQAMYTDSLIPDIPKGIYSARYGDTEFLEAALTTPRMRYPNLASGAIFSVSCQEQVYATSPAELETDLDAYTATSSPARYALLGSAQSLFDLCELWQSAPLDPPDKAPLSSDIPILIFEGGFDPTTPPYLGEQLASHLERATLIKFPYLGHAPSTALGTDCPLSLAAVFLYDSSQALDPTCGQDTEIHFNVK